MKKVPGDDKLKHEVTNMKIEKEYLFVLYDGRAKFGNTDSASIYITAQTEKEAKKDGKDRSFDDGIWYQYEVNSKSELINPKVRWDLPPASIY